MQTSYQKIQQPVLIPQPPVIQKQTRMYDQGTYMTNQPGIMNQMYPQAMANPMMGMGMYSQY